MQDPENVKLGTVHNLYKLYFLGGCGGGVVSGVLSRHSYCFPPSLYMNSCISIFDRGFLARTGVDCTVGGVCVCVWCVFDVTVMCAILSGVIAGVCMRV